MKSLQKALMSISGEYSDTRLQLCELSGEKMEGTISLSGRVLDKETLASVKAAIKTRFPKERIVSRKVKILRKGSPVQMTVATNLTSVHKSTSFLSEQIDQMVFGRQVEVLEKDGNWAFVSQEDGYLGWTYIPYLGSHRAPNPTHIIMTPSVEIRCTPNPGAEPVSVLYAGTPVRILEEANGWGYVDANLKGWLQIEAVRAYADIPRTKESRQRTLLQDAARMTGTPYLWGGVSGNGIDCSGLARLLHKWVGIEIPRDADLQANAGKPVEPPFQIGDLLFFGSKGEKRNITHVAISLGEWRVIHSSRSRNGVYCDDVQEVASLQNSYLLAATYINS